LLVGQGVGQAVPQPQSGAMAHAANQALQRGDAGQQHFVRQQPGGGPVEQQTRPIVPSPAQHVKPACQPEAGGPVLLQVAEPVVLADGRGMAPALPAVAIGGQARYWHLAKLTRHDRDYGKGRLGRIVKEGTEKPRCPKLDRKADPVVGAAHLPDQFAVGGIEVEVAGELLIVRIAGIAAVARTLVVRQETARHGVRNSGFRGGHVGYEPPAWPILQFDKVFANGPLQRWPG